MYTGPDTPAGTRREQAYASLKAALLRGDLPAGERLGEERLAVELGVSRTPVREALVRMLSEGLVERHADGGYAPALPDLHTIRELYDVRFALERWALSHPPHDRDLLLALQADWLVLEPPSDADVDAEFVLLDEDFHIRLAASAGNGALVDQLQAVNERIRVVRVHDFLDAERVATTIRQHLGVVESVLVGDLVEAERRLVDHFAESLTFVEERAALAIARMVGRWRR